MAQEKGRYFFIQHPVYDAQVVVIYTEEENPLFTENFKKLVPPGRDKNKRAAVEITEDASRLVIFKEHYPERFSMLDNIETEELDGIRYKHILYRMAC